VIILKKNKLKVKKQVWVVLAIIIFLSIGIYAGINVYKDIQYKKTNEYKLLQVGYTLDEINVLENNLKQKELETLFNSSKNDFLLSLFSEKYYLKKNLDRYLNYQLNNSDLSSNEIVSIVNTNTDYEFYDHDLNTDITKDYLLLVNKYYHLDSEYEPDDLVSVNNKYYYGSNHKIRSDVYEAFKNMWNAAYEDGIYLIINSSYRTHKTQIEVYDDYKNSNGTTYADSIAARPGYSEHQTGLSLDIFSKEHGSVASNNMYKFFDREGNTLVLRPDITPSVARAATKYFMDDDALDIENMLFESSGGKNIITTQPSKPLINSDMPETVQEDKVEETKIIAKSTNLSRTSIFMLQIPKISKKGTSAGEIKIPSYLRDLIPAFWGWPKEYSVKKDSAEKSKICTFKIVDTSDANTIITDENVKLFQKEGENSFSILSEKLIELDLQENDILRFIKTQCETGYYFTCEVVRSSATEYPIWEQFCTNLLKGSKRKYGMM